MIHLFFTNTFDNNELLPVSAMYQKRAVSQQRNPVVNSVHSDINECLFQFWTSFVNRNAPVLHMPVRCRGRNLQQLCYGTDPENRGRAQYAVCYNKNTLIPEFTGHILYPFAPQEGGRDEWAIDQTVGKLFSILLDYSFCVCLF